MNHRYVTVSSSATDFTPAMASSEDLLSTTPTFLSRLGHGCRSYNQPGMQTALHRVRSRTFIAHLPPLPYRVTERISGFGSPRYLALSVKPTRGSHRVQVTSSSSFLQIPHWLHFTVLSLLGQIYEVSSGTLAPAYISLSDLQSRSVPGRDY
jgi:hypothetical protein